MDAAGETRVFENDQSVCQFLHYGYVTGGKIDLPISVEEDTRDRKSSRHPVSLHALVCEGIDKLSGACEAMLKVSANAAMHVVPISGGMDSRAILGGLLQTVEASHIQTVTFGTPGTWDFEIGRLVAEEAGVANTRIDLSKVSWDSQALVRFAGECERPVPLFEGYLFHLMRIRFGRECVYWSGFMGEALTGLHLPPRSSTSWAQARSHFMAWNRFAHSVNLLPPYIQLEDSLRASPLYGSGILSYDDQLDFGVRQQCYIKPIVLLRGYRYRTPFLHPAWVSFILGVPRTYREKQFLYKEVLKSAYPKLFSLPVKNNYGLPLASPRWRQILRRQGLRMRAAAKRFVPWIHWGTSASINYIDFDRGLRERRDLKGVVCESVQDLKKRGVVDWIDIDAIWDRHQKRRGNHADALTLLASLEINLKAQEKQAQCGSYISPVL